METIENRSNRLGVGEASGRVRDDARQLASSVNELTTRARDAIDTMLEERPYIVIGAAFAVGYVLAGGLRSKLTGLLVTLGGRYLINNMSAQLLSGVRR